ncbi:GMC oxidoreductase [Streptomyces antimycoticus]|uniref:GMC oxidoreductase n=1 Tax=Streptomyces antimycoticus TaxID=68175 RepID=A0ABD5J3G7_9ACTN|nr:GMC oxidoreductase [Streptomyces violaceusniger]MEE4582898.1 GMC oxidoreductase [Streptomyces sp. DSM 41602]WTB03441.1 GMC oxidoreductase [Streptomyces antimycoticus]
MTAASAAPAARCGSTVVDPRLRVRGVEGPRIADGPIMPSIVPAHTDAACVMIGEMAAELVRADASDGSPRPLTTEGRSPGSNPHSRSAPVWSTRRRRCRGDSGPH